MSAMARSHSMLSRGNFASSQWEKLRACAAPVVAKSRRNVQVKSWLRGQVPQRLKDLKNSGDPKNRKSSEDPKGSEDLKSSERLKDQMIAVMKEPPAVDRDKTAVKNQIIAITQEAPAVKKEETSAKQETIAAGKEAAAAAKQKITAKMGKTEAKKETIETEVTQIETIKKEFATNARPKWPTCLCL